MENKILTKKTVPRKQKINLAVSHLPLTQDERLKILRSIRGMWKNRKQDPIQELKRIRQGWNRKIA